jgi:hypothetical protein
VLRASAACEAAGVPSASLVCSGFTGQAAATAIGLGLPNLPLAVVPGHPGSQSPEELRANITGVTAEAVIRALTEAPATATQGAEPGPREVVFRGGFDAVNRHFCEQELSDGLPIVPPTRERIEAFLAFTDAPADEVLGVLLPDNREATVWSVAVNGVMAGCRPEYMPILVALVRAMADPAFGVEHCGNTPGGETLIILNGPIIRQLGFNYTQGVLRDGFLPNTSVGRFWRLYLRNVAGFLPHRTDKATYGNTWRVVLAENEEVLRTIGWEPTSAEMGFAAGENSVTLSRYTGGAVLASVSGSTPEEILPYIADSLVKQAMWTVQFTVGVGMGTLRPLVLLSPILAETIAKGGWSKADVKAYLFQHARLPAWEFERYLADWSSQRTWTLREEVRRGHIPPLYHESDDPDRLVPIVWKPEDFMLAVTGDPGRNNAYVFAHTGFLGYPVGLRVGLPRDWDRRLAAARAAGA